MRTLTGLVCAALAVVGLGAVSPGEATAAPLRYVALGDSAAAGPLLPGQDMTSPGCLRSVHNYPAVVAARIGASLTDVTCSSARTEHLVDAEQATVSGSVKPQVSVLGPDTDIVTVTVGANDINLFVTALSCIDVIPGRGCATPQAEARLRTLIADTAPRWGRMLDTIATRAPSARIAVIGYGTYIRSGGCPGRQPLQPRDADHLQSVIDAVNSAMSAQARARSMKFIDIRGVTKGHDICAEPSQAHYWGIVPNQLAAPLHPTALGMRAIGSYVADQLA